MNNFSLNELKLAFSEIGWGIKSYEILESINNIDETKAEVNLLEPDKIVIISCSLSGWKLINHHVSYSTLS